MFFCGEADWRTRFRIRRDLESGTALVWRDKGVDGGPMMKYRKNTLWQIQINTMDEPRLKGFFILKFFFVRSGLLIACVSATTIRASIAKMSNNIKYMFLPWIMSLSSWKFWNNFQTRLPLNVFFVLLKIYKRYLLGYFHWNLRTNLFSYTSTYRWKMNFICKKYVFYKNIKNQSVLTLSSTLLKKMYICIYILKNVTVTHGNKRCRVATCIVMCLITV